MVPTYVSFIQAAILLAIASTLGAVVAAYYLRERLLQLRAQGIDLAPSVDLTLGFRFSAPSLSRMISAPGEIKNSDVRVQRAIGAIRILQKVRMAALILAAALIVFGYLLVNSPQLG